MVDALPPPDLDKIDRQLVRFLQNPISTHGQPWLKCIREALGLTASGLAEKLEIPRQAISQFEQREVSGKITLENLQKFASAMDCEFVYGLVPKGHSSFSQMITSKALRFVQKPELKSELRKPRRYMALGSRIKNSFHKLIVLRS